MAAFVLGSAALLSAAGCEEDLGKCDEDKARSLVVNGEGQALYAGQAIINRSCAAGQCHASGATGEARQGVPKDLDFNLEPARVVEAGAEGSVVSSGVSVDAKGLSTLRQNQRRVFDVRGGIWDQIQDGLMPPEGIGAAFREAVAGGDIVINGAACTRGSEDLSPISKGSARSIVKNWLACGAPVVEVSNAAIPVSALEQTPAGRPGTVGQQMPLCSDPNAPVSFDSLFDNVIKPSCVAGCHTADGIWAQLDLTTADGAYAALTMPDAKDRTADCADLPFVVPGKPEESYLVAKMGGDTTPPLALCGVTMPFGQAVLEGGLAQVVKWIEQGATRTGAGAADAGM